MQEEIAILPGAPSSWMFAFVVERCGCVVQMFSWIKSARIMPPQATNKSRFILMGLLTFLDWPGIVRDNDGKIGPE